MSAPYAGRQSPDPERQSGAQQGTTAKNPNDQGVESKSADETKDALKNLESNPSHVLQEEAEKKTSKNA